eukprot:COSAG05_NODE_840_length_7027_cov_416.630052_7_plen_221_part_00
MCVCVNVCVCVCVYVSVRACVGGVCVAHLAGGRGVVAGGEETATFNMADVRAVYKDFDNGYKQCSPTYNLMFAVLNRQANNFVQVCLSCGRRIGFDDGQCKGPIRCPHVSKMKDTGKEVTYQEYQKRNVGKVLNKPFYGKYGSHGDWTNFGWGEAAGLGRVGERGLTAPLFDSAQKVTQNFFTNTALSLINFTLADHQLGPMRRSHHWTSCSSLSSRYKM